MRDKYYIELVGCQTKLNLTIKKLLDKQTKCLKTNKIATFNYITSEIFNKVNGYLKKSKTIYEKERQERESKKND